jgi:hypothetical protein
MGFMDKYVAGFVFAASAKEIEVCPSSSEKRSNMVKHGQVTEK